MIDLLRPPVLLFAGVTLACGPLAAAPPAIPQSRVAGGAAGANAVTEFEGELKQTRGRLLMVTKADGTDVLVQAPQEVTGLVFTADAERSFLKQGLPVRFTAEFTPAGAPTAPLDEVSIYQPVPTKRLGRAARQRFVPGVYPLSPRQKVRGGLPASPRGPSEFRIVGKVMGIDAEGLMMVQAGNRPIRIPLAPDASLKIRFNHLRLAQPGDTVAVSGFYQPPDERRVRAERVTVQSDRVFGEDAGERGGQGRRGGRDRGGPAAEAGAAANRAGGDAAGAPGDRRQ